MQDVYIGLMSGTSLDGVDGVLVGFDGPAGLEVIAHEHRGFDPALRAELLALNSPAHDELHRAALAANALTRVYAEVVDALRPAARWPVRAVGAHGQTVRHRPGEFDGTGYTLQLLAPALLAEWCGIDVIADFRSRDVAAGGQGAPLVPTFHAACFGRPGEDRAVVNIGGIANLSLLASDGTVRGHDCGPGNVLMDAWCMRHLGQPFDADGAWAAQGRVSAALLAALQGHPYFTRPAPKSTGRDDFHLAWLDAVLTTSPGEEAADVQATLCELTAASIANDAHSGLPTAAELIVCGGGALNRELLRRLQTLWPAGPVIPSDERGLPPLQVEACAFAWLARAHLNGVPGNLASVTGARGPRVLGAHHRAGAQA